MKKSMVLLAAFLVFCVPAYAQTGGCATCEQKEQAEAPKGMMQMCMPMMKQMMGQSTMMQDMTQMMMDMMGMQEKLIAGVTPPEKKQMMTDMAEMKELARKMMAAQTGMTGMMGADDSEAKLKCAEEWLKKAIDLHEIHIKDPRTATEDSQMEMMDQMKRAYECITGGTPEKTEPHKH